MMTMTDIVPGEQVSVWNVNNGQRIDLCDRAARGSGQIVVNGAAARHFHPGDTVIIMASCLSDEPLEPRMIVVDEGNRFVRSLTGSEPLQELARR